MEVVKERRRRRARPEASRKLQVDVTAENAYSCLVGDLRSARLNAGLSQNAVAEGLPVRGRAVSEWETEAIEPTLAHLMQWCRELGLHLVIIGRDGKPRTGAVGRRHGETWEIFEQRRLAVPLRNRRLALDLTQKVTGRLVGVSRDSIQRWELTHVPPRPIALIVWAQKLGYSVAVQPISGSRRSRRAGGRRRGRVGTRKLTHHRVVTR